MDDFKGPLRSNKVDERKVLMLDNSKNLRKIIAFHKRRVAENKDGTCHVCELVYSRFLLTLRNKLDRSMELGANKLNFY